MIFQDLIAKSTAETVNQLGNQADFRSEYQTMATSSQLHGGQLQINLCFARTCDTPEQKPSSRRLSQKNLNRHLLLFGQRLRRLKTMLRGRCTRFANKALLRRQALFSTNATTLQQAVDKPSTKAITLKILLPSATTTRYQGSLKVLLATGEFF
ncbi:MAG: Uncharacterised protein [Prochlorococcus marinus str. MIT 9215]|nr:MAG: Uncharacterised protein [Prochlorococcus marinus str. MIT 9215]